MYNTIDIFRLRIFVMINFAKFNSLVEIALYFDTPKKCKEAIAQSRWADGDVVCPYCGKHHCYTRSDGRYICGKCHKSFSVLVGTIFENTKISLVKWFMAMYLISSHKKGVSSHQLSRDLNVTQKTAWFILHKVRTLFAQDDSVALEGEVELDEMYLGGRETNKHESKKTANTQGRSTKTKTPIFGMVARKGFAHAFVVKDVKSETLKPYIQQFCADHAHLFTDELISYSGLGKMGYVHDVIEHGKKQFSNGNGVTTNSIEGFWGHFKRMVFCTYHFVSKAYLQRYVDEAIYRYNTRETSQSERFCDMFAKSLGIVTYRDVKMASAA